MAIDGPITDLVEGAEDFRAASDAYVYGYPLVTMEMTRRVITNVAQVAGTRGPMGQVIKMRAYPDASFRDVTAPNADTLYTTAFFDVGDEPWVLSVPDMKGRYFLLPFLDGWTNVFAVPGSRTTGTQAQTFVITGPGWSGAVPEGLTQLKSPTAIVWLLGRIYCTGTPEDYAEVHALQDAFKLQPLSTWGKDYTPPAGKVDPAIDMKKPVRDQVNGLSTVEFFTLLADLMKRNPPAPADAPALARFKTIGLNPGQSFDGKALDSRWDRRLPQLSYDRIMLHSRRSSGRTAGCSRPRPAFTEPTISNAPSSPRSGSAPTVRRTRSIRCRSAPRCSSPTKAGDNYTLRFEKGELPPVKGFWSLTMYDEQMFFVANPINRYSMSLRTNPKFEPDGSLVIYIQNENPGPDKEANWLPAPKGKFHLMLRLYWPDENEPSILDGSWVVPAVKRA